MDIVRETYGWEVRVSTKDRELMEKLRDSQSWVVGKCRRPMNEKPRPWAGVSSLGWRWRSDSNRRLIDLQSIA